MRHISWAAAAIGLWTLAVPVRAARAQAKLDVLFVIDNSGSMGEEQVSLTNNFTSFMNVLANIDGGLPDLHIGVVSTNVGAGGFDITGCAGGGDDGRLQNEARFGCTPPSGYYISDEIGAGGERVKNYTGTLEDTFSCIARLGTFGCGFEQPFESMKRALDGSNAQNAGFLRPDAYLAVVFLSDEDDCSATDGTLYDPSQDGLSSTLGPMSSYRCTEFGVMCDGATLPREAGSYTTCEPRTDSYVRSPEYYVTFLKALKADPGQILVAGIVGNPVPFGVSVDPVSLEPKLDPSCSTIAGSAAPGVRFKWFLEQFPDRNTFVSICNEDLSDGLILIGELLAGATTAPDAGPGGDPDAAPTATPDAAPFADDAGDSPGPDAGAPVGGDDGGGCGCRTAGTPRPSAAFLLLGLLALLRRHGVSWRP